MTDKKDQIIICASCGQQFVWTKEEQEFFESKGLHPPKLCLICKALRKTAASDQFRGKSAIAKELEKKL
ncbi:hypothetical protein GYA49_04400 [Candidatus Beckwithbacteria bacterium]|nr:hypothetical protein [Candidatus Beckwithbacteria bacterium]